MEKVQVAAAFPDNLVLQLTKVNRPKLVIHLEEPPIQYIFEVEGVSGHL